MAGKSICKNPKRKLKEVLPQGNKYCLVTKQIKIHSLKTKFYENVTICILFCDDIAQIVIEIKQKQNM